MVFITFCDHIKKLGLFPSVYNANQNISICCWFNVYTIYFPSVEEEGIGFGENIKQRSFRW